MLRIEQLPYFTWRFTRNILSVAPWTGDCFSRHKSWRRASALAMPRRRGMFLLDIMQD